MERPVRNPGSKTSPSAQPERSRLNRNMQSKASTNLNNLKRQDPDKVLPTLPAPPQPEPDMGPLSKARVAKGRSIHVPTGVKRVVGSKAYDVAGTIVHRDITAVEFHSAQPGEIVELPEAEIERLTALGFLVALDDQPARRGNGKATVTGVADDPRVAQR